jgi:hypothetical protein
MHRTRQGKQPVTGPIATTGGQASVDPDGDAPMGQPRLYTRNYGADKKLLKYRKCLAAAACLDFTSRNDSSS